MKSQSICLILGLLWNSCHVKSTGEGEVRLTGGDGYRKGTVEIYHDLSWGIVCDDDWDINDASVVCRQLGLGPAIASRDEAYFGTGHGTIFLDDVACNGFEARLDQCQHNGWNSHNCDIIEAAGVECSYLPSNNVRLAGGSSFNSGRVELYYDGSWGTLCDDNWDNEEANVICRQLGYAGVENYYSSAYFGVGSGPILRHLECVGNEYQWTDCYFSDWGSNYCSHWEDAGVTCRNEALYSTTSLYWPTITVRLQDGSSRNEGRVEVYWQWQWYTVCDDNWDITDATVVCRQLGYPAASAAVLQSGFGDGGGAILLDEVMCTGYESSLIECSNDGLFVHDCSRNEIAGVVCSADSSEGNVRLIGASLENEGRVEIYHDGAWGTVCDDDWDINDAEVVCNQLGFPGALMALEYSYFGQGTGPVLLDGVSCKGDEHYLTDCWHDGWYNHDCKHIEDAGVSCNMPNIYYPRLVDGDQWSEGRVEIWNGNQWTKLCSNEGFWENEANVICKELGFDGVDHIIYSDRFGEGNAAPSDVYFSCTSYEDSLSQCDRFSRLDYYCTCSALRCQYSDNNPLSVGAIIGTVIGLVIFIILCSVCCVVIFQLSKAQTTRRRNPPNVAIISGSTNPAGPTVHLAADPALLTMTGNVQTPPSYNDVMSNPGYYPNIAFNTNADGGHL